MISTTIKGTALSLHNQHKLVNAIMEFRKLFVDPVWIAKVQQAGAFSYSKQDGGDGKIDGRELVRILNQWDVSSKAEIVQIVVKPMRYRVLGYVTRSKPYTIHLNSKRIGSRSFSSLVGTLAHECVHLADYWSTERFGHGSNRPAGKGGSAPYWIGKMTAEMVDHKDVEYQQCRIVRKRIWWAPWRFRKYTVCA